MEYYFAPMEGITGGEFRRVHHRYFSGVDKYYMPFLSPTREHLFTQRERRNMDPEVNRGIPAVPQLLTKSAEDFLWAANALGEMGYEEGLGKTRPQNLRTQREEKQKKNDKPHIRQLVGYGLRCGQDSLAFSNELFGGFLMHGEETGRITNHEVCDADVRNGDLLRLNHPRAI